MYEKLRLIDKINNYEQVNMKGHLHSGDLKATGCKVRYNVINLL